MCVYMHACMYRWIYYILVKTVEQMDQDHPKIVDNLFHGGGWVSVCLCVCVCGGGQCFLTLCSPAPPPFCGDPCTITMS